jgi:glycosylphosphatidylinositol phospholipase D
MDFPPFNSFDSILVVVDRLTKIIHFIHCKKTITNKKIVKIFLAHIFQNHGLLEDIIFYHGPQFASKFWRRLFELFGVKVKLSLSFHPQMDGQTKRDNKILERYLQCTTNHHQDN